MDDKDDKAMHWAAENAEVIERVEAALPAGWELVAVEDFSGYYVKFAVADFEKMGAEGVSVWPDYDG